LASFLKAQSIYLSIETKQSGQRLKKTSDSALHGD
jgi:hypothetical protein